MPSPDFQDTGRTTAVSCKRDVYPYTWYVSCGMSAYAALAGVRFDRLFGDLDAIRDGASGTFCAIGRTMVEPSQASKVRAYMDAARQVGQLLDEGIPREHLHKYL